MSDGHGSKRSSDGLISASIVAVALLAVAGLSIFWGYSKQVEYYRNADQNSSEYTRNTYAPEADRCIILPRESQSDCIAEASNKERTYRRDEQDLAAQKTSAVWAYLMGSAALIGMILSAFGVFLVWRTFSATRESNLITREIGEAQVRAYIRVSIQGIGDGAVIQNETCPAFELKMDNVGQTPAYKVRHIAFAGKLPKIFPHPCRDLAVKHPDSHWVETSLFPRDDIKASIDSTLTWGEIFPLLETNDTHTYYVAGVIWYQDVFERDHKRRFCFKVSLEVYPDAPRKGKMIAHYPIFSMANAHNDET
jgi:hypothetical protein